MDKELIAVVIIPKYIRKIQVSKSRRATYYKQGETIPEKYASKLAIDYQWVRFKDGIFLCDANDEPVIKNKNSVGTPKCKLINGQDLHTLTMKDYERSKIVKAIKEQFIPYVEKMEVITRFPIRILMELYDTIDDVELSTNGAWDIDNRAVWYSKVFQDVLSGSKMITKEGKVKKLICTSKQIIPDDNRLYISQPPSPLFFPIDNAEDRKLVFKIYHDNREVITRNRRYNEIRNQSI